VNRKDFIQRASALGLGVFFLPSFITGCSEEDDIPTFNVNFDGDVLIIGAGAAGITAGYALQQYGINFQILEASGVVGGRMKAIDNFADFPIDLGAEWIHTNPNVLAKLINDESINTDIGIINYKPESLQVWKNDELKKRNFYTNFYGEYKFKNTTWFSYFNDFFVPQIQSNIQLDTVIRSVDYSGERVLVTDQNGNEYTADRLIITVPVTVMQDGDITFNPPLPTNKTQAFSRINMPDGIKVFIEFSEKFYPDMMFDGPLFEALSDTEGEKIYYDAAFRKDSNRNILGLFSVGEPSSQYARITDDNELIQFILNELDERFDGTPSRTYIQHVTQNWSQEPFIRGSYTHNGEVEDYETMAASVNNKLFFAGETYHTENTATVHGAAQTAYAAVEELLLNRA